MGDEQPGILEELEQMRAAVAAKDAQLEELRQELSRPLRLKEFAARLGVAPITARRMAKRGLATKLAGDWLFDPALIARRKE